MSDDCGVFRAMRHQHEEGDAGAGAKQHAEHSDQDRALGDDREVAIDLEERHVSPDHLQDDDGDDRAEDAAATAREADAAKDNRRDALEGVRAGDR